MSKYRLNRPLILERTQRISDGAGGFQESWGALGTLWGAVALGSGQVSRGQGAALSASSHKITVRAAPVGSTERPQPGQRFRLDQRLFRIEAVNECDASGRFLICHCQEEIAL